MSYVVQAISAGFLEALLWYWVLFAAMRGTLGSPGFRDGWRGFWPAWAILALLWMVWPSTGLEPAWQLARTLFVPPLLLGPLIRRVYRR